MITLNYHRGKVRAIIYCALEESGAHHFFFVPIVIWTGRSREYQCLYLLLQAI